jgi:hypothetical protein
VTVLSAAQDAGFRLQGVKPSTLFSTSDQFSLELAGLANSVAVDNIAKSYDWRGLTKLCTLTGDGVKIAFDLPTDFERMPMVAEVHSLAWKTAKFRAVQDLDEWLYIQDNLVTGTPGNWIMLGGQMQIFPAMPIGETARFYYISNQVVALAAGQPGTKTGFTLDTDALALPERLLTLGLIWRWRSQKRMEYSEDLANFEIAKSEEITKDKGRRVLTVGRQRATTNASLAYPGRLGP